MRLIAIETSTDGCSAALYDGDEVRHLFELAPRRHADLLLEMLGTLLGEAGLTPGNVDAVAFGAGPGAFTGLRIAAASAQGIALAHELPLIPVSSLAALALRLMDASGLDCALPLLDARMDEVYSGAYRRHGTGVAAVREDVVCPPADTPLPDTGQWVVGGPGWPAYRSVLEARLGPVLGARLDDQYPRAREVAILALPLLERGEMLTPDQAVPVYLRDKVT